MAPIKPTEAMERCPLGETDYEECFAPFRYCPVKGCGRAEGGVQLPVPGDEPLPAAEPTVDLAAISERCLDPSREPVVTAPIEPTGRDECRSMIVIRPERVGGVIFRCTRTAGHQGEHTNGGMAEEYPLVENATDLPFLVRWAS